jgi:integrase
VKSNDRALSIQRFENVSGTISYRVFGYLHGERVRRNFKTREEAAAEKTGLEIRAMQVGAGHRPQLTSLSEVQVREAESAFLRLAGKPHALSFYLDFALANYRPPETAKRLDAAVANYLAARQREMEQDQLSAPQYGKIRRELKRCEERFKNTPLAEITSVAITEYLECSKPTMKTHNNRRGVLSTFFKFGFQRGWIAENPILKVPHYRIRRKRGGATTLTVHQVEALFDFLEEYQGGKWVPYFALCIFAGIRPGVPHGEITKLRPEAVNLEGSVIHISADVSKVREPRRVAIQPNLAAWLRAYPLNELPIVLGNFKKRRQKFANRFGLTHDVLRHTFISMFVAKFRSIGEAAIQAGNSESIIRKHYLDLKSKEEGDQFFGIMPRRAYADATQENDSVSYSPEAA